MEYVQSTTKIYSHEYELTDNLVVTRDCEYTHTRTE